MFFPLKDENPTERRPVLTISLIVLNVAIFVLSYLSGFYGSIVEEYGMVPVEIVNGSELSTIFTSMFLHGGILHLVGNVWFLWIFGDNIEDLYGRPKFLLIYIGSGIFASLAHVALNPSSTIPTIGASGAIAGILGAYIVKYPRAKVVTLLFIFLFIQIVKIPSFIFLGIWIGLQFLSASVATIAGTEVTIAYWAHIGGFLAGLLMALGLGERISRSREKITEEYFNL